MRGPRNSTRARTVAAMTELALEQVRRVGVAAWDPERPAAGGRTVGASVAAHVARVCVLLEGVSSSGAELLWRRAVRGLGYVAHDVTAPWSDPPVTAWAPGLLTSERAQAAFDALLPAMGRPSAPRPSALDLDRRWPEVRALVRSKYGGWMRRNGIEMLDAEQEVYLGLLRRQQGATAYDPQRAGWARYVVLVAGSVLSHMVQREQRRQKRERRWAEQEGLRGAAVDRESQSSAKAAARCPEDAIVEWIDSARKGPKEA